MYQDPRDQITPTTDPDLCETHSGHSQHSADAAPGRDWSPGLPAHASPGPPCAHAAAPEALAVSLVGVLSVCNGLGRIITGAVCVLILIPVCIFSHTIIWPLMISVVSMIGVEEMLRCIGAREEKQFAIPANINKA